MVKETDHQFSRTSQYIEQVTASTEEIAAATNNILENAERLARKD